MIARIKRWCWRNFWRDCLREATIRKIRGEKGLEVAIRFFRFKIYQCSKK